MKKKSIMISALGLVLCLSLVLTVVFHSPLVAFAVEMPEDNSYVFETGDAFHVIGWYGDWKNDYPKPTGKRWIDSKLTYNGSKWKTDPYMRWQNTDQPQNFLGVWPYNLVDSSTDLTNISYNTLTATEKDILVARTTLTQKPADNTVPMAFDHLMSRFDVNLSFANQYQSVDDVVVKVNVGTDATINLIANNITLGNEQNDVNLNVIDTVTGMDCSRSGILIPQTKTDVVITIDFKADGLMKSVTYTMPELKLESGKRTTLNLLVGDEVVAIENVTVSDWADGGNIAGGEAEECMHQTVDKGYCANCGLKFFDYDEESNAAIARNAADLLAWSKVVQFYPSLNLVLADDITLTGANNWIPVGTDNAPYSGTIDGAGHTITGLSINNSTPFNGFVGYLRDGTVKDLTLADVSITSTGNQTAALVGYNNSGTVMNCHVTSGSVTGAQFVGGVVGSNLSGTIIACSNQASVSSSDKCVGGIASYSMGGSVRAYIIASWTKETNEKDYNGIVEEKDGIGYNVNGWSVISACFSGDAAAVNAQVTDMNDAIAAYNETAVVKFDYRWVAGTDGYPTLVKIN